MKVFAIILVVVIGSVLAEPPRQRFRQLSRQETPPAPQPAAPYAPSGWKPQGARFALPARQTAYNPPKPTYGPPSPSYGPPKDTYGPPTTTDISITTEEQSTDINTEEPEAESFKVTPLKGQKQKQTAENIERGQYYLLLSDGRLQRVMYVTSADLRKMAYSARLRYQDVEPITGPIFTSASNAPFIPVFQKK